MKTIPICILFKKYLRSFLQQKEGMGNPATRRLRWGWAVGRRQGHSLSAHPTWGRSEERSGITYTVREPSACSDGSANMVSASGDESRWFTRSRKHHSFSLWLPQDAESITPPPTHTQLTRGPGLALGGPRWDTRSLTPSFPREVLELRQGMVA